MKAGLRSSESGTDHRLLWSVPQGLRTGEIYQKWGLNVGRVANLRSVAKVANRPPDDAQDASSI